MKSNKYIEVLAIPGMDDYDLFDHFYDIGKKNFDDVGLWGSQVLTKQRSLVMSDDVCMFVSMLNLYV